MMLVDLRNHGRSTEVEGVNPPHDLVNSAKDLADLVKANGWSWPDVVIGHSLGGKVALQFMELCSWLTRRWSQELSKDNGFVRSTYIWFWSTSQEDDICSCRWLQKNLRQTEKQSFRTVVMSQDILSVRFKRLSAAWRKKFGEEVGEDSLYVVSVDRVLQMEDFMEDGIWVASADYKIASPDPLRDVAEDIVNNINTNNMEDIFHFCNVYVDLDFVVSGENAAKRTMEAEILKTEKKAEIVGYKETTLLFFFPVLDGLEMKQLVDLFCFVTI
ncbi:unnamed protein product [Eruca vesicaria subsp. sativa]|uniref:AB hydrolase-1 domain-containing protein n=1 Tax=Eruca vesicaria subsp. sativa TaxID=29727 RepID=A0ABC8KXY7_ERUVS|nr:unnamed protein product [Eruca vesicaria subsp. sativa]